MSLLLLIYVLNLLDEFDKALTLISMITIIVTFLMSIIWFYNSEEASKHYNHEDTRKRHKQLSEWSAKYTKIGLLLIGIFSLMDFVVPSKKTGYLMVGAYMAQELANSEVAQKVWSESSNISGKIVKIINKELDGYLEENKDAVESGK